MKKKSAFLMYLFILVALVLSSCAAPAAPTQPAKTEAAAPAAEPVQTEAPAATEPPAGTEAPAPTEPPAETAAPAGSSLILATTTSTQDSGLLDYLLPLYTEETGVKVDVIAVGTGQALKLGEDGNADVLLVHARAKEDDFMAAGHGSRREDVMYNDFVIVGPESDPAAIKKSASVIDAFKAIASAQAPFISRGDESGTHTKELGIWKKAEIEPAGDWYISAGQGMGEVLTMANEQQAYTLSDRATYLARSKEGLDLVILVEGDKDLLNPYGVIAVNPEKSPQIKADLAKQFIDWIISLPVQEKIAQFGMEDFGESLFIPDSQAWRDAHAGAPAGEEAAAAALKITGLVEQEMSWTEADLKAMETISVESTNKAGEKQSNTGVLLSQLLELAGLKPEAAKVVLAAGDGFTAEIPLADLQACTDCILAFREDGSFGSVMPNFPGSMQVKGLVEIQVQ